MMKGLIDSTLREGSQTFGLAFTLAQKKEIFSGLCSVGVEEIEVGVATSLDRDMPNLFKSCRLHDRKRRLALWCLCRQEDILYAHTMRPDVLSLSIPVSDIHIEKKFGRDRNWVVKTARTSIREARQMKFKYISLGLEDSFRANKEFVKEVVEAAVAEGVDRIRLADTVGIASPFEIAELVRYVKSSGNLEVGVHAHNDFGMATANSLIALDAGADWADVTVLGLGERSGNARLEELVSYLTLQKGKSYKLAVLKKFTKAVAEMSGRTIEAHSPIIGKKIFYCETGLHLQGLNKDSTTYEPFSPHIVGAIRKLQYGSKVGRKEVMSCLGETKKHSVNFNVNEIAIAFRKAAEVAGRPLQKSELLSLITPGSE